MALLFLSVEIFKFMTEGVSKMPEGTVKWFNEKKNHGFIESEGQSDIFFHSSKIIDHGFFGLKKADRVTFEIKDTKYGRQAVNIRVIS